MNPTTKARVKTQVKASPLNRARLPLLLRHRSPDPLLIADEIRLYGMKHGGY